MEEETSPSLEELETAFSIDNVTKEFFLNYKELYLGLKESLGKVIENDPYVKREFEEKDISTIDFAKKLLGQIVFIYFLQKKGWLGVGKDETGRFKSWGIGPKNFLRKLLDKEIVPYDNFFNDILEPLFYEALATERDDDYYSRFNCKIPFLNGGLFEPINDYDWVGTEIVLSNSVFEKILKTFDQYNFTVKEDEPLEKEVAIDPEMLGKVFENLLDIKDRKSTGRYYTPREIVHYMCQKSLINYLETNTPISIPRDDIEKFIQLGDFALDLTIRAQEQKRQYHGKTFKIDESLAIPKPIEDDYKEIDKRLKEIKIVDPAVGSGAFPIGMMNEIVKARSLLTLFFDEDEQKKRSVYKFKREAIENSLYGVDIDSSAVDITKLRFWLSLIVDEEDIKNIKPLPNLDHKIMCGNSLLEEFGGVKLFDEKLLIEIPKDYSYQLEQIDREVNKLNQELHEIHTGMIEDNGRTKQIQRELRDLKRNKQQILSGPNEDVPQVTLDEAFQKRIRESQKKLKELKELQKKFFNEQNRKLKKQYAEEIDRIEWELIEETLREEGNEEAMQKLLQYKKNKSKPFFLWGLYFSEVFQRENPGFDVVIGNPPYGADLTTEEKRLFKSLFSDVHIRTPDTFNYFISKGLKIVCVDGVLSYIVSNNLLFQNEYIKTRELFCKQNKIISVLNLGESVFESVVPSCVFIVQNNYYSNYNFNYSDLRNSFKQTKRLDIEKITQSFSKQDLLRTPSLVFGVSQKSLQLIEKISKKSFLIDELAKEVASGISTGGDKIFRVCEETIVNNDIEGEILHNVLIGREINKYQFSDTHHHIIYTTRKTNIENHPLLKEYLLLYEKQLSKRSECKAGILPWFSLNRQRYLELFTEEKIIIRQTADKIIATYDNKGFFVLDSIIILKLKEDSGFSHKYALAILNSSLSNFIYQNISQESGRVFAQVKPKNLRKLFIPNVSKEEQKTVIKIVDQILNITKDDDYLDNAEKQTKVKKLEEQIDELVYELYELTPEEIEIVEGFNKEK
jgi:hypothetical protein